MKCFITYQMSNKCAKKQASERLENMYKHTNDDKFFKVKKLIKTKAFNNYKKKAENLFNSLQTIIEDEINNLNEGVGFSVGTMFPNHRWEKIPELSALYQLIKDEKETGTVLGIIVYNFLVEYDKEWITSKTNLAGREFETNFYFKKTS